MTNDLKNFLENEQEEFGKEFINNNMYLLHTLPYVKNDIKKERKDHDARLINFVLDLVEKEVEKKFGDGNNEALVIIEPTLSGVSQRPALKDISTIINNLRV